MSAVVAFTSVLLTLAALAFTVWSARAATRIRVGFDVARSAVAVVVIVVMAVITGVATRSELLACAVIGGGALGVAQGAALRVEPGERGLTARRSPIGLALWGAGIVVMQVGGVMTRTGAIRIGQTLAVFSAAMGIGLLLGRRGPMARARERSGAGRAVAGSVATIAVLVGLVGIGGWWAPDRASAEGETTYQGQVAVASRPLLKPYYLDSSDVRLVVADDVVTATVKFTLVAALRTSGDKATCIGTMSRAYAGRAPMAASVSIPLSLTGSSNALGGDCEGLTAPVVATQTLTGTFSDGRFVGNIRGVWSITAVRTSGGSSPPSTATPSTPVTPTGPSAPSVTALPPTLGQQPAVDASSSAVDGPADDVTPEEAAAAAAAGLVGAAAIGLITLGESAARFGGSGGGPRRGGPGTAGPPEPYIDPVDGRPLPVDPATGRVWWPWDGGSGHWVDPAEAPGLIAQWDRELESETARRVGRHDAQREQDWQDLHDRIRRSEAEEAARRAAEQARLDAFDRRVEAARAWMEEADAGSLDQLDRIAERAANQGFVTDEDLAQAAGIADRSRVWADTRRQWDADDWIRITANRNAVLGVTAKGISMLIDPTKGLTSGFIWGVAESWDRGDSLATVVGNGIFEGAVLRGGYAVGGWGPGRAVLGNIGWGTLSGAVTAAGEVLLRGGTLDEAWEAGKAGFVLGGLGGVLEDAAAGRPPPEVPTIRSRPGGRSHWDHPLDPRHIDELDPRFRPPGTPAEQTHVPPTSPWDWSQPPPRFDESSADGGPPADVPVIRNRPGGPTPYYDQPSGGGLLPGDPRSPWDPSQPPQELPTPIGDVEVRVDPSDPRSSWGWSSQPPKDGDLPGWGPEVPETPPVRPTPAPSPVAPERPLPGPPPAAPEDLLAGARPSRPSVDVLDDMMRQPRQQAAAEQPSGGRVPDWQRGFFPDAEGRTMIDTDGRVVVGDRQIGSVDPETGTLRNLGGQPMTVALDHRGVPVGYLEQPDVPPGMRPAYSERGTLAGYVDEHGRADLGGRRVPVAIDADGSLVPYEAPGARSGDGLDDLRLASQGRVPVLDEGGAVDHFVEPGPREIHYRDGVPHYVQRQYPVRGTSMQDIVIDRSRPPAELQRMPTPEVYDLTQVSCPLVGEGAPPPAPQVGPPNPQGGER